MEKHEETKQLREQIGEWLRKAIKQLGLTHDLVIEASGIRRSTFYVLLKGGMSSQATGYVFSSPP